MGKLKLAKIETDSWELEDGEAKNSENPTSFFIPSLESRQNLLPDDKAKLILRIRTVNDKDVEEDNVEGMWVIVREKKEDFFVGILDTTAECTDEMKMGMEVLFEARHVVQVHVQKKR